MTNTMTILSQVRTMVMKGLTASDVEHMDKDDLDQEIYLRTLELLQQGTSTYEIAERVIIHIKGKAKKRATDEETVALFEDLIGSCVAALRTVTKDRMEEQIRARNAVDDLLSTVLDEDEEALIRLRFGIPTPEMIDSYKSCGIVLEIRPYTPLEAISVRDLAAGRTPNVSASRVRSVLDMETQALKKLNANGKAFYLLY